MSNINLNKNFVKIFTSNFKFVEIFVYIYIEIKFGFNLKDKIAQFLQKLGLN